MPKHLLLGQASGNLSLTMGLGREPLLPGCVSVQFSSVQPLSLVRLFATLRSAARQASLVITNPEMPTPGAHCMNGMKRLCVARL